MRCFRYSLKAVFVAITLVAGACAAAAFVWRPIRMEAAAGRQLEVIGRDEAKENGRVSGNVVSWLAPTARWHRALYHAACSPGHVARVDIVGNRSAHIVSRNARWLSHVDHIRLIGAGAAGRAEITGDQIRAASRFDHLEELEFYGAICSSTSLAPLARVKSIRFLNVESDTFAAETIREIGSIKADRVRIWCQGEHSVLPSEAFASFEQASFTQVEIWGALDDRAFELIASAPHLVCLEIYNDNAGRITDDGMRRACKRLRVSILRFHFPIDVTDACIDDVARVRSLQEVELAGWELTTNGLDLLRTRRPDMIVQ